MIDVIQALTGKWWTFLLRGVVALAVAAFAFVAPGPMSTALVYIVAAYFIITGLLAIVAGLSFTGIGNWWLLVLYGIGSGALGIIMLTQPGAGPLALAYLIAIWAFSTGMMEIASAIALRDVIRNEFWWVLLGIVTFALGVYIVIRPDLGVLALVYAVGIYSVIAGISLIAFSFRVKGAADDVRKLTSAPSAQTGAAAR
ncbi:MAG: HdeD family acid-resistance protein [Candidatus Eremiobacteraeota bacterium]|nr:HdeD family acid-resistance protein [Candidatus Eremiobacteraeota bacterium]MBV8364962.1 HdeD family acid-resistance protein [Candidatus Eremiobacteraeota bacterium]